MQLHVSYFKVLNINTYVPYNIVVYTEFYFLK